MSLRRLLLVLAVLVVKPSVARTTRTAVVVLGYDPRGVNWERVVWGDPQARLLGRVPQGVLIAVRFEAQLIILGSGEVNGADGPRAKGEDPVAALERRLLDLARFGGPLAELSPEALRRDVLPLCVGESTARNTRDELRRALALCALRGCDTVVLVSSPTHVPRCIRDACSLLEAGAVTEAHGLSLNVLACPCGTSFDEAQGASAVAIVEPPHRAASEERRGVPELHELVARILALALPRQLALCERLAALLELDASAR
jgi:uncharacterized SAM-binding protein YcdF (DUF218 family)